MSIYADEVARYTLRMPPLIYKDSGVYALSCAKTEKPYIGCSTQLEKRLRAHVSQLRAGKHHNGKLQSSWNKYGERSFTFSIIEYTEDIYEREAHWVKVFDSEKTGLNLTLGGDGCALGNRQAETARREKINAALRTDAARARVGAWSKKQWAENYEAMRGVRSEVAKKAWADPVLRASISAVRKATWAARSPEERAAIMAKMWATRRSNKK